LTTAKPVAANAAAPMAAVLAMLEPNFESDFWVREVALSNALNEFVASRSPAF
jgi:hypothetical protein